MRHGTYIGDEPTLQGKTAHLMTGSRSNEVRAQFDDSSLRLGHEWLGFHWHNVPRSAFKLAPEVDFDV
jgi:hypothetical protein